MSGLISHPWALPLGSPESGARCPPDLPLGGVAAPQTPQTPCTSISYSLVFLFLCFVVCCFYCLIICSAFFGEVDRPWEVLAGLLAKLHVECIKKLVWGLFGG